MPKRILQGKVVSTDMDKTIAVKVERYSKDLLYKKYVRKHKKYLAHDESNGCKVGDVVSIQECRPLSKRKTFEVIVAKKDKKDKKAD